MASLIDFVTQQLGNTSASSIGQQIGADEAKTRTAMASAIPSLVEALGRAAAEPDNAQKIHDLVANNKGDDLLAGLNERIDQENRSEASRGDSNQLEEILGSKHKQVESSVRQLSGLDANAVSKLVKMMAPVVLAGLARQQKSAKLDTGGLSDYIGKERDKMHQEAPEQAGLLAKMIDQDGDGDFDTADMLSLGTSIAGKLFR